MKRNTVVLGITLFTLAVLGWAGWANWEYRKQAAERAMAGTAQAQLVPAAADGQDELVPLIGKPAPGFALEDIHGKKVSLADFKGHPVMINFWATWCGPCKIETPWIVDLRQQYAPQGFEVVGISTDIPDGDNEAGMRQVRADVTRFVHENHMQYPVLLNGDTLSHPYGGLDAMPTSFFVNASGTIVAAQMGITSKDDLEANIRKAIGAAK